MVSSMKLKLSILRSFSTPQKRRVREEISFREKKYSVHLLCRRYFVIVDEKFHFTMSLPYESVTVRDTVRDRVRTWVDIQQPVRKKTELTLRPYTLYPIPAAP